MNWIERKFTYFLGIFLDRFNCIWSLCGEMHWILLHETHLIGYFVRWIDIIKIHQFSIWYLDSVNLLYNLFLVKAIEFRSFFIHYYSILFCWIVWNKEDYIIAAFKYRKGVFNVLNEIFPAVVIRIWLFNQSHQMGVLMSIFGTWFLPAQTFCPSSANHTV